ncbi:MAG: helix-turn-helix transcriptional regulator [Acidimicrobiales bacterium]
MRTARRRGVPGPPDRSWARLSPPQALLVRRLSVFVDGWTVDAACQVCGAEDLDAIEIESLHAVLAEKSLVTVASGDPPRYRMPRSVRTTAVRKAAEAGESEWARQRHARWCVTLVEAEQDEGLMAGDAWLRHLDSEVANLEVALAWARGGGDAQLGIRLVLSMVRYWAFRGQLHEAVDWVTWAVSQADDDTPSTLRAAIVRRAAVVQCRLGQAETAQALADEATVLYRRIGHAEAAGPARHLISLCRRRPGDTLAAIEPSLEYARRAREVVPLAQLVAIRGQAVLYLGRLGAARGDFDECVELGRRHGRGDAVLLGLLGLARVELVAGNFAVAARQLGDTLVMAEQADDHPNQGIALALSGELSRRRGDGAAAREMLDRAVEIDGAEGGTLTLARDLYFLAHLERDFGVPDEAHALFDEALALGRCSDGPAYHEARCLLGLAVTTGDVAIARGLAEQAAEMATANEDRVAMAGCLLVLARLGRVAGDGPAPGTRMCQDAMKLCRAVGDLPGLTASLEELAALFADVGRSEAAARLLGAAETLRETGGYARPPADEADYRRTREKVTDALGAQWERARMEGRTLSATDAVATAWAGRGRAVGVNDGWESLTPAEQGVARLVAKGLTSAEVASRLFISSRTVETHLAHLYAKLAIHSRRELGRWIEGSGITDPAQ